MAILKDFTVTVQVDGQPVHEYDDETEGNQGPSQVTKYIEAISETRFTIKIDVSRSMIFTSDGLLFKLMLDGRDVTSSYYSKAEHVHGTTTIRDVKIRSSAGFTRKAFLFSEIKRLEEATSNTGHLIPDSLNGIGTIGLKITRCNFVGYTEPSVCTKDIGLGKITEIHEKKLKGKSLTHSTKLGKEEPCLPYSTISCTHTDGRVPIASFNFKYCSREALQSMLIIPRSPSALARDERPVNDLTLEELRAFVETARNQTRATVNREGKVKNEAGDKAERNSGGKRKREVETMTARGNRPVEMIDLSGDD